MATVSHDAPASPEKRLQRSRVLVPEMCAPLLDTKLGPNTASKSTASPP